MMALIAFWRLVLMCIGITAVIGSRLPRSGSVADSEDMATRLRYTMGDLDSDGPNVHRLTALLPGTPFIKLLSIKTGTEDPASAPIQSVIKVRQGSPVTLKCEVIGMPSPIAYWNRNGHPMTIFGTTTHTMPPSSNVVELMANDGRPSVETAITIATLSLPCASAGDAGVYQCVGDNGSGKIIGETRLVIEEPEEPAAPQCQSDGQSLEAPPTIYMYTDMRMEYVGNDAQLNCRAEGRPMPIITWQDADGAPVRGGRNYTILPNGDLLVKRVNFGDARPYRQFTCQASNGSGADSAVIGLLSLKPSDKK